MGECGGGALTAVEVEAVVVVAAVGGKARGGCCKRRPRGSDLVLASHALRTIHRRLSRAAKPIPLVVVVL